MAGKGTAPRPRPVWRFLVLGGVLSLALAVKPAEAKGVLLDVDFVHPLQFSAEQQNAKLAELQSLGVRVIRFGMYAQDEDKNVDFIKRAYARKIETVLLHGLYGPGAPERPFRPKEFPGMWPGPPLSALDPDRSAQYFGELFGKLDADGVTLAGLELENEINMVWNNPDFRLPGEGRVLGLVARRRRFDGLQIVSTAGVSPAVLKNTATNPSKSLRRATSATRSTEPGIRPEIAALKHGDLAVAQQYCSDGVEPRY